GDQVGHRRCGQQQRAGLVDQDVVLAEVGDVGDVQDRDVAGHRDADPDQRVHRPAGVAAGAPPVDDAERDGPGRDRDAEQRADQADVVVQAGRVDDHQEVGRAGGAAAGGSGVPEQVGGDRVGDVPGVVGGDDDAVGAAAELAVRPGEAEVAEAA